MLTVPVGEIDEESQRLIDVTKASLDAAIEAVRDRGSGWSDIGGRVRGRGSLAAGFSVVREYVGHGIGTAMHEEPDGPELRAARPGPPSSGRGS